MINKVLTVKGKILMTVLTVVLLFALFILFYFPARQEYYLLKNYDDEVENFARTVALGVKIALTEQNFEGVETAIDFVRHDERLVFVSLIQADTLISGDGTVQLEKTVFKSFPEGVQVDPAAVSNELFILKSAPFSTPMMSGEILLSFSTKEIIKSLNQIRRTSIIASVVVFFIGFIIGYLLARNISRPVLALRDAANRVGEGDFTQSVKNKSSDEIGELTVAFNKMVRDLGTEASRERVRTKAIAMRHSIDIEITIASLLRELDHIGLASEYSWIGIINSVEKRADFWTTSIPDGEKESLSKGMISLSGHSFLEGMLKAWENKEPYTYILRGEDYHRYYELFSASGAQLSMDSVMESSSHALLYCYTAMFNEGALTIFRSQPLEEGSIRLLQRFADVFHLGYTRYLDLRKSEISGIEEMKQAALDRVRGKIASMRTKDDLTRITRVIWDELTRLGVPFIRCGVFIVDKKQKSLESYLSTPSGDSLGVFNLPLDASDIAKKIIDHWQKGIVYKEHWDQHQFIKFMENMMEQGRIESKETYQGAASPPQSLDLHFFPFSQGMLYVGNTAPLIAEELQLAQSLAEVFSGAYARYEDFMLLEEAKNKTEKTLNELKSTQTQLIHAEKMASLGELTAGIAHEIQNPLNFVNNFSEINKELLAEMNAEIDKGNYDDVKAIAKTITENEEKVITHGKRADSIVKGMLQHSRSSSGVKEPTDINALADEYLRLAYHGLRAKEKSFNATMKTDFDPGIGTVNIIPQDLGRVILNLITNAFYAVTEKKNQIQGGSGYDPTIIVATKRRNSKVEIRVQDNGNGIPPNVLNKIFQPFFTTKPTGQGTGLGLSMSYDIVTKSHRGELKVETKEGEGTSFIIILKT